MEVSGLAAHIVDNQEDVVDGIKFMDAAVPLTLATLAHNHLGA